VTMSKTTNYLSLVSDAQSLAMSQPPTIMYVYWSLLIVSVVTNSDWRCGGSRNKSILNLKFKI